MLSLDDALLTRGQAAAYLSLRPQTLAAWASAGRNLPYVKVGRAVRYRQSDVDQYIERQTVPAGV